MPDVMADDQEGPCAAVRAWAVERLDELVDDLAVLVDTETPSTDPLLLATGRALLTGWILECWPGATVTTLVPSKRSKLNGWRSTLPPARVNAAANQSSVRVSTLVPTR